MSYLEMVNAPLPDMSSGIISIWFRGVSKQQENPPPAELWPQAFWTQANANIVMVPPNAQYSIGYDPDFKNKSVFYFNPYGIPTGGEVFGDLFLGAAPVWIPNSPPVPLNTMITTGTAIDGIADVDMSKFGIRTLLTFGNPNIDYNYCTWRADQPDVIPAVVYPPSTGIGGESGVVPEWPKPYRPYLKVIAGEPIGVDGLLKVVNYRINGPTPKGKVPQSFIGIDKDGHIVINLQTNTTATYRGMSFELNNITEMWASPTYVQIDGPPYTYTQVGFPFPDGHWVKLDGFWLGYQFEYRDISQEIMGCAPESFLIYANTMGLIDFAFGAPVVENGGWHHLLFSFDISGSVTTEQSESNSPVINSGCKAWMAFDDRNITGANLQNRPPVHDGFLLPKLRGTETTSILDCGPCTAYGRAQTKQGANVILPRNAWLHGFQGNPKDSLFRFVAAAPIIEDNGEPHNNQALAYGGVVGNFNWIDWTGMIWPLYGHGVAPGDWQATYSPMHPTVPDPREDLDIPQYSCSGFSIPVRGHPIGIPASTAFAKYNTGVEMAELQIWANKTLDTGDEKMRRLFLDYPKDEDGNPDLSQPLQPVDPSEAEKVLGKPDILLHGSEDWQAGTNTGKRAFDAAGMEVPVPQFRPIAKIEPFVPDPELGK